MEPNHFLAFDIGASSGRAMLGSLENGKLKLTEVHRFKNQMMRIHNTHFWNVYSLFEELKTGLRKCIADYGIQPESIGIDTWGVDYALLTSQGRLTGLPFAYRDHRTDNSMEEFFKLIPREETYRLSGIQFMQFNTLFQLFASVQNNDRELANAESLLFTPDVLNYFFTGIQKNEYTIASTSQMFKPGMAEWEYKLFDAAGIDRKFGGEIIQPGTVLGNILQEVQSETGSAEIPCIAVASHDTASAVVSVPADGNNWAFISSGTWSLLGIESREPIVSEKALEINFTNEGGVEGTTRFLKNIMGMWLIQECKRIWEKDKEITWHEIVDLSNASEPFKYLIDPDDSTFLNPENMPEAIQNYCSKTGQSVPQGIGEIARCIYDSLALKYKYTIGQIEEITGKKIEKLHVIGGGAYNQMMNQFTANATGIPVTAGPTEATAIGNILMQAKAVGKLKSLKEIREIVGNSFEVNEFIPDNETDWKNAFKKFEKIISY